jgi:hypothetical protein
MDSELRRGRHVVAALALATALTTAAPSAFAQGFRFTTEDDLVRSHQTSDDLYTFSVALDVQRRDTGVSLLENAFTDRAAGVRFDETYLSVGRRLAGASPWNVYVEAGVAHVGRGLFGERAQNAVHRAIGDQEVNLRYLESSFHPRLAATVGRTWSLGRRFEAGPSLEGELVPGVKSHAVVAAEARWRPARPIALELLGGERFTHASYAPLRSHLAARGSVARLSVVVVDRIFVSWSYNDYGARREHLSAGWRLPLGRGARPGD